MGVTSTTAAASAFNLPPVMAGGAASSAVFSNASLGITAEAPKTLNAQANAAKNKATSCAGRNREALVASSVIISKYNCSGEIDTWEKEIRLITDKSVANSSESQDALIAAIDLSRCYLKIGDTLKGEQKIEEITGCLDLFAIGEAYRMGLEKSHSDGKNATIIERQNEIQIIADKLNELQLKANDLESTSHLSTEAAYSQNMGESGKYTEMWQNATVKEFKALEADPALGFQWLNNRTYVSNNNAKVTILKPQNCSSETPLVIVAPGRSEPMQSYKEMAGEFVEDGMAVAVLGFSGNGDIGYTGDVQTFAHYRHAITELVDNATAYTDFSPENIHVVAHSTGGFGAMNAFQHGALENVTSVSLIAPMFGLPISNFEATTGAILTAIKSTFLRTNPHRDYLATPEEWFESEFDGNTLTQSQQRYKELNQNRIDTNQTAPTWSWGLSSVRETKALRDTSSAMTDENKPKFTGKISIYAGTADRVVDNSAINKVVMDLQKLSYDVSLYSIYGGFHMLHQEADPYRQRMISNIHNTIKQTSQKKHEAKVEATKPRSKRSARLNFS